MGHRPPRLEGTLSKARILELYVNVIELGPRIYGVEAASRRYFRKSASALSAQEAATAGSRFSVLGLQFSRRGLPN